MDADRIAPTVWRTVCLLLGAYFLIAAYGGAGGWVATGGFALIFLGIFGD